MILKQALGGFLQAAGNDQGAKHRDHESGSPYQVAATIARQTSPRGIPWHYKHVFFKRKHFYSAGGMKANQHRELQTEHLQLGIKYHKLQRELGHEDNILQ